MNLVRLTATVTILSAATWLLSPDHAEASEWGCECSCAHYPRIRPGEECRPVTLQCIG